MAGYVINNKEPKETFEFHIDTWNVVHRIREVAILSNTRVITFQLDGDELEAALWGFENYKKPIIPK